MKSLTKRITIFIVLLALIFTMGGELFSAFAVTASAEENTIDIESSDPLEDLQGSTIEGSSFNLESYYFDQSKSTQLLSIIEYEYSFKTDLKDNFALYVYVYNPKALSFVEGNSHKIGLRVGKDESKNFKHYNLSYVSKSSATNYEGLIYKFKVDLTVEELNSIWNTNVNNANVRLYSVSEIELETTNGITEVVGCGAEYTYIGYMAGCGSSAYAQSTLACNVVKSDTLSLNVHPTYFRPEGTNGKDFTQDTLHSVYFSVPNDFISKYGEMTAVHATWLDVVLKPMLVTGNREAYSAITSYLGKSNLSGLDYAYLGSGKEILQDGNYHWTGDLAYNMPSVNERYYTENEIATPLSIIYMLFATDQLDVVDSADSYLLTSEALMDRLEKTYSKFGGEAVENKYSSLIFKTIASEYTDVNITSEDEYALTSETISQNFFEKWFGQHTVHTSTFDGIKAIQKVTSHDIQGNPSEVSKNLFISEADYKNFYDFCNTAMKADETVYLFRYQVSDYFSQEASLFHNNVDGLGRDRWQFVDSNAYFFYQTVNLGFDIIDVTFTSGESKTVIPVVMSPMDIVHDSTPPLDTKSDVEEEPWWQKIIALLLLILLATFVWPLLSPILTPIFTIIFSTIWNGVKSVVGFIISVITAPFRLIWRLLFPK